MDKSECVQKAKSGLSDIAECLHGAEIETKAPEVFEAYKTLQSWLNTEYDNLDKESSAEEPAEGETVTKTTVTKSKDGLAGDTTPEEEEMLASITGGGGLSGETTPEEDEMLSHFDNILKGLRGLQ